MVDAVAQVTKQGFLFVFDRVTGEPLWPIEERPVPKSDMPGEQAWPTQPFPTNPPPFARQKFTSADLSPYMPPEERARFKDEVESARNEGLFTPPGLRNTVEMPGNNGGANWGGAAIDPTNGTLYVASKDLPSMLKLEPERALVTPPNGSVEQQGLAVYRAKCQLCHHADLQGQPPTVPSLVNLNARLSSEQVQRMVTHGKGLMPAFTALRSDELQHLTAFLFSKSPTELKPASVETQTLATTPVAHYRTGFGFMLTAEGVSPISPPWASLTAYDLNQGTIKWKIPMGEVPELAAKGIKGTGIHFPKYGPVVTAGGIIFTGTRDRKVRAVDEQTGKVIWETAVSTGMEGIPAVYEVNGREYIVFCAAAQSALKGATAVTGGAYIAFALADN
jgi:quinoprotein glucose dehydrogenase